MAPFVSIFKSLTKMMIVNCLVVRIEKCVPKYETATNRSYTLVLYLIKKPELEIDSNYTYTEYCFHCFHVLVYCVVMTFHIPFKIHHIFLSFIIQKFEQNCTQPLPKELHECRIYVSQVIFGIIRK